MAEHLALDVGGVLVACLLIVIGVFAILSIRRWLLEHRGGTVECSLRATHLRSVWRLGIGRYSGDELLWFAIFGLRLRPRQVIHRRGLSVARRRDPGDDEVTALPPDAAIVELRNRDQEVELAMSDAALTGFLAWLEAAPPGSPVDHL